MSDKLLNMLGLARRAGAVEYGEGRVLSAVRSGKVKALVIAADASDGAKKKLLNSCAYYKVPYIEYASGMALGAAIGAGFTAAAAVTDENFAAGLMKLGGNDIL